MASKATFRILSVTCKDETGPGWREGWGFGNDEIQAAVFSADLRGSTKNSGRIKIYNNFDDGDKYTMPADDRAVVTLDLAGMQGDVELAFVVHLIESQLMEGEAIDKAWQAFVDLYKDSLKEELGKAKLSEEKAREIAQPNYLGPRAGHTEGSVPENLVRGVSLGGSMGTSSASSSSTSSAADAAAESEKDEEKSLSEKVGGALEAAVITACALFIVKYGGAMISALWGLTQDKVFPPVQLKVKINGSASVEEVPPNATGVLEFRGHDGRYLLEWDVLVTPG